jgi:hypothetical protein
LGTMYNDVAFHKSFYRHLPIWSSQLSTTYVDKLSQDIDAYAVIIDTRPTLKPRESTKAVILYFKFAEI